jgi:8-oxo-dGTP pyrophosphatase MutT (NUDIX family)
VFRREGEEVLHAGKRFTTTRLRVSSPDGEVHEREMVHHPGAVAVLPLHDDATVTLVTQYRAPLDMEVVEIPAGLRDVEGEPEVDTAARELVEETGLEADRLEHLVTFHNSPGFSDEVVTVFVATGLREVPHDRQGAEEEHMTLSRVPLDEAVDLVRSGRITDAKTVIALLLAAPRG